MGRFIDVGRFDANPGTDIIVAGRNWVRCYSGTPSGNFPESWRARVDDLESMAVIGDLDQDGYDDIAFGIPSFASDRGRVSIRSGRRGAVLTQRDGPPGSTERLGASVANAGDHNGDRVPDILVGSPGASGGRGKIQILAGLQLTTMIQRTGTIVRGALGARVAPLEGDHDSDGIRDHLVSENATSGNGFVHIVSGLNLQTLASRNGTTPNFGSSFASLNSDGDDIPEIITSEDGVAVQLQDRLPEANPPRFTIYGRSTQPGFGSSGRIPRISSSSPARIGGVHTIDLHGANQNASTFLALGLGRTDLPLDILGLSRGSLLVDSIQVTRPTTTNALGQARSSLTIPLDPPIIGVKLNWQWFTLDPSANALGLTASDGGETTIGRD